MRDFVSLPFIMMLIKDKATRKVEVPTPVAMFRCVLSYKLILTTPVLTRSVILVYLSGRVVLRLFFLCCYNAAVDVRGSADGKLHR